MFSTVLSTVCQQLLHGEASRLLKLSEPIGWIVHNAKDNNKNQSHWYRQHANKTTCEYDNEALKDGVTTALAYYEVCACIIMITLSQFVQCC